MLNQSYRRIRHAQKFVEKTFEGGSQIMKFVKEFSLERFCYTVDCPFSSRDILPLGLRNLLSRKATFVLVKISTGRKLEWQWATIYTYYHLQCITLKL